MKRKKTLIYTYCLWTLFSVTTPTFANEVPYSSEETTSSHLQSQESIQGAIPVENSEDPMAGPTTIENLLVTGETLIHQSTSTTEDEAFFSYC